MLMPLFIDYLLSSNVIGVISKVKAAQICQYLTFKIVVHSVFQCSLRCCCSTSRRRGAIPC